MKNQYLELLQKDIEIFRFSITNTTQTDAESKLFSNRDFELSNLKIVAKLLNKKFNNDVIENVLWMCVNRELSAREIAHISYERIKSLDKVQLKLV